MSQQITNPGDLILSRVNPGDLIKSELINAIIANIEELNRALAGTGGVGLVSVPNMVGLTLAAARALLTQPTTHMNLGAVFDVFGQNVSAVLASAQPRLIVNQVPPSGARVVSGTALDLVLAGVPSAGGGTTTPSQLPVITLFTPPNPRIGESLTISGDNFETTPALNEIFFGPERRQAPEPSFSNRATIIVEVPEIAAPPTGTQEKPDVPVFVKTTRGEVQGRVTIRARSAVPLPTIGTVLTPAGNPPNTIVPGDRITINGTAFAATPARNVVSFESFRATPTGAGTGGSGLLVIVPPTLGTDLNMSEGDERTIQMTVRNLDTDRTSLARNITLAIPVPG